MRRLMLLLLVLCVLLAGCDISGDDSSGSENSGKLDTSFNKPYGFAVAPEDSGGVIAYSRLAVQKDGGIVVVGTAVSGDWVTSLLVTRYTANGQLDTGFGQGGSVRYSTGSGCQGRAVAIADDSGKIVACGQVATTIGTQVLVLRLNTDGTLDTDFGTNGVVIMPVLPVSPARAYAQALGLQPGGAVIVGGYAESKDLSSKAFVLRLTTGGVLDTSFATDGIFLQDSGVDYSSISGLAIADTGVIIAAGQVHNDLSEAPMGMLLALTADGRIVTSFGAHGNGMSYYLDPDGGAWLSDVAWISGMKVIAVGQHAGTDETTDMLAIRCDQNGLDQTFGEDGTFSYDLADEDVLQGVALLPDGKILTAGVAAGTGEENFVVLKLTAGGRLDTDFGRQGVFTYEPGSTELAHASGLAVQGNRGVVVCGSTMPEALGSDEGLILRLHK